MSIFYIKIIAIIAMCIDHIGMVFFPEHDIYRIIGRLSFPLFAWLIANGAIHTSDIRKYMVRLLIFALISQTPYFLVMTQVDVPYIGLNIFVTLFIGLAAIYTYKGISNRLVSFVAIIAMCIIGELIHTGYGSVGILSILGFYIFRERPILLFVFQSALFTLPYLSSSFQFISTQPWAILALPVIFFYNGKLGPKLKYIFYVIYPLHLLVLYGVYRFINS